MQRRLGRTGQTNGNDPEADAKGRAREDSGAPWAGEGRGQPRARGELGEARMPSRGMRVRRKRGEQLLSCQREPLNLPADLLTIVPASYHRAFAFFLRPLSFRPPPLSPSFLPFRHFVSSAPNTTISSSNGWKIGHRCNETMTLLRFCRVFYPFKWNIRIKVKVKVLVQRNVLKCPTSKLKTPRESHVSEIERRIIVEAKNVP